MRTFIIVATLVSSCLAVSQEYEIPSGKVSFSSNTQFNGVYGQQGVYGGVQPAFRYGGQVEVKPFYGDFQPAVKQVVAQPVPEYKAYGAQPVHDYKVYGVQSVESAKPFGFPAVQGVRPFGAQVGGVKSFGVQAVEGVKGFNVQSVQDYLAYGVQPINDFKAYGVQPVNDFKAYSVQPVEEKFNVGYVQPAVRVQASSKVVKPFVPFPAPVAPFVNKYVADSKISHQVVTPFQQHVTPFSFSRVSPYPVIQQTPYVHSFEKAVKPVVATPVVHPFVSYASPVARVGHVAPVTPSFKYSPGVAPVFQAVPKYGAVVPVSRQLQSVALSGEAPAAIVSQTQKANAEGSFVSNFQTENGIQSTVTGAVKPVFGSDEPAQVMTGSYSYISPDGTPVVTNWYADENGFHADGDHIPAVPEEIQRSLEYANTAPFVQQEYKPVHQY